ncbi:MAG: MATE family efflux transporter, partial [Clostridiaceae bacterium]|nr:MATE family efflux transporter [Clostridiaceae bacterium]
SSTAAILFNVVLLAMGTAVSVMIGQTLGTGDINRAKAYVWKLMFFNVCICLAVSGVLVALSPIIPRIYKTTEEVRRLATHFMITNAVYMVFNAISNSTYFTIRSGGKTLITFLFDSVYTWAFCIPFTYVITHFTEFDIFVI